MRCARSRRRLELTWLIGATVVVATLSAQAPPLPPRAAAPLARMVPVGTGSVSGVVLSADTGRPVRNARVTLTGTAGTADEEARFASAGDVSIGTSAATIGTAPGQVTPLLPARSPARPATLPLARTSVSDSEGRFTFPHLPAGRYMLRAQHDNYLQVTFGQRRHNGPGTTIPLEDASHLSLSLTLPRPGVIAGTVTDDDGEPLRGANVQAWRLSSPRGGARLQATGGMTTDDRGGYRLHGLQPGEYIVGAQPRASSDLPAPIAAEMAALELAISERRVQAAEAPGRPAYVTLPRAVPEARAELRPNLLHVFSPGTVSPAAAAVLRVTPGAELSADIAITRVPATVVRGSLLGDYREGMTTRVSLVSADPMSTLRSIAAGVAQDGRYSFASVPPGRYTLTALVASPARPAPRAGAPAQPSTPSSAATTNWFARQELVVSGEPVIDVVLAPQRGRSISGTAVFEQELGMVTPMITAAPSQMSTGLAGPLPNARVEDDGRFTFTGVVPGSYTFNGPRPLKSALVDGVDVLDFPLEFTGDRDLTDVVLTFGFIDTAVTGRLTDRAGRPQPDVTIVLAAADDRFWTPASRRIVTRRTGAGGRFQFTGQPPGDYVIAAVDDPEEDALFERAFLESLLAIGTRVTLAEGMTVTRDLRLP